MMESLKVLRTIIIAVLVINGIVVLWLVIKVQGGRGPIPLALLNGAALLLGIGSLALLRSIIKKINPRAGNPEPQPWKL